MHAITFTPLSQKTLSSGRNPKGKDRSDYALPKLSNHCGPHVLMYCVLCSEQTCIQPTPENKIFARHWILRIKTPNQNKFSLKAG